MSLLSLVPTSPVQGLLNALGTANVTAIYDGLTASSITTVSNAVTNWNDARGATGFAPPLIPIGGAGGFQVIYTDVDTNASTTPLAFPNSVATGNLTTTQLSGAVYVNAKTATAITYTFGYTSVGATPMQYAIHVRCIWVG